MNFTKICSWVNVKSVKICITLLLCAFGCEPTKMYKNRWKCKMQKCKIHASSCRCSSFPGQHICSRNVIWVWLANTNYLLNRSTSPVTDNSSPLVHMTRKLNSGILNILRTFKLMAKRRLRKLKLIVTFHHRSVPMYQISFLG